MIRMSCYTVCRVRKEMYVIKMACLLVSEGQYVKKKKNQYQYLDN